MLRVSLPFLLSHFSARDLYQHQEITKDGKTYMPDCNYEDADTCPMLHACFADTAIVNVAEDTDVSVLMVLAYCIEKHFGKGYFKIDHKKYVDNGKVVDCLGEDKSSF